MRAVIKVTVGTEMRSLVAKLSGALTALLVAGCLSSGTGYDLARSTLKDRAALDVPAEEDAGSVRKQLLDLLTAAGPSTSSSCVRPWNRCCGRLEPWRPTGSRR